MKTRILTAIVSLAVFIGLLLLPPIVFTIALAIVTLMMLYECYSATKADAAMKIVGFVSAALIMGAVYPRYMGFGGYSQTAFLLIAVMVSIMLHMLLVVFEHGKKNYKEVLSNGFLTFYIILSTACILFTKASRGTSLMLLIFIAAWSTDTCAYFSGRFFGKHKLIPHVSPNKTVEGAIGGVIGAIVVCFIYICIKELIDGSTVKTMVTWSPILLLWAAIFGGAGGIFSQLGDLVASSIKRDTEIKDFGWIFPGHGGFMDRFDSVIFIAPIIYGLLMILG